MASSTSDVAACCSRASFNSLPRPEYDECFNRIVVDAGRRLVLLGLRPFGRAASAFSPRSAYRSSLMAAPCPPPLGSNQAILSGETDILEGLNEPNSCSPVSAAGHTRPVTLDLPTRRLPLHSKSDQRCAPLQDVAKGQRRDDAPQPATDYHSVNQLTLISRRPIYYFSMESKFETVITASAVGVAGRHGGRDRVRGALRFGLLYRGNPRHGGSNCSRHRGANCPRFLRQKPR